MREARHPPAQRRLVPSVERVPPALAGGAEVVGRYAGDHGGLAVLVEEEEIAVRPDIGAVVGHEDRQIADQRDPERRAVALQGLPVAREEELLESLLVDLAAQRVTCALQR